MYARLNVFKKLNAGYMTDPDKTKIADKAALDLDVASKRFNGKRMEHVTGYER